jgi:hypothetical protein
VSTSDKGGRLADGSPLCLRDHVTVFVPDCTAHGDLGLVANRDADIGVVLAVVDVPEDRLWVLGGALAQSRGDGM